MKRIALIADTHGNYLAFDAVLTDLQRSSVESIVCLGDMVPGPFPGEMIERLRRLACPQIMGDAEANMLLDEEEAQRKTESLPGLPEFNTWAWSKLRRKDRPFLEQFQQTLEIELEGGRRLLCFHGSPHALDTWLYPETPEDEFRRELEAYQSFVLVGGHTHRQQLRRLGKTIFFNPGSAGLAYRKYLPEERFHFDPWAEYAILTSDGQTLSLDFRHIPFDVKALIQRLLSSDMPGAEGLVTRFQKEEESEVFSKE